MAANTGSVRVQRAQMKRNATVLNQTVDPPNSEWYSTRKPISFFQWNMGKGWFCINSSVNFAKHFCWLVIRLGSDPIKFKIIIKKGRERTREKTGVIRAQRAQTRLKKAALTELKGEKDRRCCLIWVLIVIGYETKKSLGWFCNLGRGRSWSFYETSQIAILVDLTSVEFDYWVTNVEFGWASNLVQR